MHDEEPWQCANQGGARWVRENGRVNKPKVEENLIFPQSGLDFGPSHCQTVKTDLTHPGKTERGQITTRQGLYFVLRGHGNVLQVFIVEQPHHRQNHYNFDRTYQVRNH